MVDKAQHHYFDRDGAPITLERWAELQADQAYRFLADELVGRYRIATIWTGMDPYRVYDEGPPEIFETTVFERGTLRSVAQAQYATAAEALAAQRAYATLAALVPQ